MFSVFRREEYFQFVFGSSEEVKSTSHRSEGSKRKNYWDIF